MAATANTPAMQQMMLDASVDMALGMTAKMFGLSKETVTKIVQVGLPMVAKMAETNPEMVAQMYKASLAIMPEPMQEFYAKMAEDPRMQEVTAEQYKTMYGDMVDAVNREAAQQAGTTEDKAGQVLGASLPAMNQALGKANTAGDAEGFAKLMRALYSSDAKE